MESRPCKNCGQPFTPRAQQVRSGGGRFCSLKCLGASRRKDPALGKGEKAERTCSRCSSQFVGRRGAICRRCITVQAGQASRASHPLAGKVNPNWKGGVTKDLRAWKRDWVRDYRLKHPDQQKARDAVKTALLKGVLVKGPCERCGSTENVQGHHHNGYAEAHRLDVQWLCRTCHNKTHGKLGGFTQEEVSSC